MKKGLTVKRYCKIINSSPCCVKATGDFFVKIYGKFVDIHMKKRYSDEKDVWCVMYTL